MGASEHGVYPQAIFLGKTDEIHWSWGNLFFQTNPHICTIYPNLVGGLEHGLYDFPYIGNDNPNGLIFFRGVETTNQK